MNKIVCFIILGISLTTYTNKVYGYINVSENQSVTLLDNFEASNVTGSTLELSWSPSSQITDISSFMIYLDNNVYTWAPGNSESYLIKGLSPERTYRFRIRIVNSSGTQSDFSNPLYVTTTATVTSYCTTLSYNDTYEFIDYVGIGEIDHVSFSDGGYIDNTDKVANVNLGINSIELSAGFSGATYEETLAVWIDFNQNKIFDASEIVVSAAVPVVPEREDMNTYQFLIPSTAKLGNTRMRVAVKYNGVPLGCAEDFAYGEVEDYTVHILPFAVRVVDQNILGDVVNQKKDLPTIKVYPNPTEKYIHIANLGTDKNFSLTDISGRVVKRGVIVGNRIEITGIQSGIHFLKIRNGDTFLSHKVMIK